MRIATYNSYPQINQTNKPLLTKHPNFGNKEEVSYDDKKALFTTIGVCLAATVLGGIYLCKSPRNIEKVKNQNEIQNKYLDVLEWINGDLKFHKRKPLTNIEVSKTPKTKNILEINDNALVINENALNNVDDFITSKIKTIKDNNLLNINFNLSSGKEANHVPSNVRLFVNEANKFEAGELTTTLEKIKLALRLIQIEQATNLLSTEPIKYLELMINGPLNNSTKTKGLLANIEKIKQLSTEEQFKLLQAYTEKSNCAWAQDHPIKSLLKDLEINLKLYFHPNNKNISTPKQNVNKNAPKILSQETIWEKNKVIINKTLKELDSPETKCIYIADPYIFKMKHNKIKTFLNQILDGIKDREIRIITINLSKKAKKALQNKDTRFNNKIIIKNLIPQSKQNPFHDRWMATSEKEFALTNSFNNTFFDNSVLMSKERYYNDSERLWNATQNNINCIIEEILI